MRYSRGGNFGSAVVTLTDGASITPDLAQGSNFRVVLGGARTLMMPDNLVTGMQGVINVWQDSTGSRTLAFDWVYRFSGGTAPTLSTGKYVRDELSYFVDNHSTSTVTMSIATPGVITWANHPLVSGMIVRFTTTGALPTGVSTGTSYWVNVVSSSTFNLSTSLANLQAGTYVATSGSQSGTHTATNCSISIYPNLGMA